MGAYLIYECSFGFCLLVFTLADTFVYTAAEALLHWGKNYFCGIPMQTEDQLRHPAFLTEQLLDSWPFCQETAIVGLARSQAVCHSNKYPFNKHRLILSVMFL